MDAGRDFNDHELRDFEGIFKKHVGEATLRVTRFKQIYIESSS
jgi:hypothetical protein